MDAHLIPFRKQPTDDIEVLYCIWNTGEGQFPAEHLHNIPGMKDYVWTWASERSPHIGAACFRPPKGKDATPVRIWGGRKWTWYWLYKKESK